LVSTRLAFFRSNNPEKILQHAFRGTTAPIDSSKIRNSVFPTDRPTLGAFENAMAHSLLFSSDDIERDSEPGEDRFALEEDRFALEDDA